MGNKYECIDHYYGHQTPVMLDTGESCSLRWSKTKSWALPPIPESWCCGGSWCLLLDFQHYWLANHQLSTNSVANHELLVSTDCFLAANLVANLSAHHLSTGEPVNLWEAKDRGWCQVKATNNTTRGVQQPVLVKNMMCENSKAPSKAQCGLRFALWQTCQGFLCMGDGRNYPEWPSGALGSRWSTISSFSLNPQR